MKIEDLTRKYPVPRPRWRVRLMVACGLLGLACLAVAIATLLWMMAQNLDPRRRAPERVASGEIALQAPLPRQVAGDPVAGVG